MRPPNVLFDQYSVSMVAAGREEAVRQRIRKLPEERLLGDTAALAAGFVAEFRFDIPVLHPPESSAAATPETLIPFEGDAEFFKVQPQTFTAVPPHAEVRGSTLVTLSADVPHTIAEIQRYLDSLAESAQRFNDALFEIVASELQRRKERLGLE